MVAILELFLDFLLTLWKIVANRCIIINFYIFSHFNEFIVSCCKCIRKIFGSYCLLVCWVDFAVKSASFLHYCFPSTCVFIAVSNKHLEYSLLVSIFIWKALAFFFFRQTFFYRSFHLRSHLILHLQSP